MNLSKLLANQQVFLRPFSKECSTVVTLQDNVPFLSSWDCKHSIAQSVSDKNAIWGLNEQLQRRITECMPIESHVFSCR